jgi:hypothetical protein
VTIATVFSSGKIRKRLNNPCQLSSARIGKKRIRQFITETKEKMEPIDHEAEYQAIIEVLKEHGGELDYKELNEILADRFEGVRLRLKTMKAKGLVEFEGVVPSFGAKIKLAD